MNAMYLCYLHALKATALKLERAYAFCRLTGKLCHSTAP